MRLALEVSQRRGFAAADFAELHPGGRLGRRLARVGDLMHPAKRCRQVEADTVIDAGDPRDDATSAWA